MVRLCRLLTLPGGWSFASEDSKGVEWSGGQWVEIAQSFREGLSPLMCFRRQPILDTLWSGMKTNGTFTPSSWGRAGYPRRPSLLNKKRNCWVKLHGQPLRRVPLRAGWKAFPPSPGTEDLVLTQSPPPDPRVSPCVKAIWETGLQRTRPKQAVRSGNCYKAGQSHVRSNYTQWGTSVFRHPRCLMQTFRNYSPLHTRCVMRCGVPVWIMVTFFRVVSSLSLAGMPFAHCPLERFSKILN